MPMGMDGDDDTPSKYEEKRRKYIVQADTRALYNVEIRNKQANKSSIMVVAMMVIIITPSDTGESRRRKRSRKGRRID